MAELLRDIFTENVLRNLSLFNVCKNCEETCRPTPKTRHITPTKYCRTPGVAGGVFPSEWSPLSAHHLLHLQKRLLLIILTSKHRSRQATDLQAIPSTEIAHALVQAELVDLSSVSHILGHSPHCTSNMFSRNYLILKKFPVPWKRRFQ